MGEHVVHSTVVRGLPADPALADRAAREQLSLADQLGDDLARRAAAIPQLIDPLDRAADLPIERQADLAVLVALKADR
jgi:hypothetical protein